MGTHTITLSSVQLILCVASIFIILVLMLPLKHWLIAFIITVSAKEIQFNSNNDDRNRIEQWITWILSMYIYQYGREPFDIKS